MIDMGDDKRDIVDTLQGSYDLAMEGCTDPLEQYEYLIKAKNEIEKLRAERAGDQQRLFHYETQLFELEKRLHKQNVRLREQWEWPTKHGTFKLVAFGFLFGAALMFLVIFLMTLTLQFKVMTLSAYASYCAQNGEEFERLRP